MPTPDDKQQDQDQRHDKDGHARGRSWDQVTKGTTSAATMGAGSTGEAGAKAERKDGGKNSQEGSGGAAGRTDDLLSGGSGEEQDDEGFQGKTPP